jgi:Cellulose binding domain
VSEDLPGEPGAAQGPDPVRGPDATDELPIMDESGGRSRGLGPQARRRWYSAMGATAGLALLAGGVVALVPRQAPPVTQLAADCGLIHCDATLPGAIVTTSPSGSAAPRPHHTTHKPASYFSIHASHSVAATTPKPSPAPPKPPPGRDVAVTYSLDSQDNHWGHNDFHAHLTIVNQGSQPVSGWVVQVTLPGDQIRWVGYQHGGWGGWDSFSTWGFSGNTLTLMANSPAEALSPASSQTVYIIGEGTSTSPSSCTFDGAACHS